AARILACAPAAPGEIIVEYGSLSATRHTAGGSSALQLATLANRVPRRVPARTRSGMPRPRTTVPLAPGVVSRATLHRRARPLENLDRLFACALSVLLTGRH